MSRSVGICFVNPNPRPRGLLARNYPPLGPLHIAGALKGEQVPCAFVDADAEDLSDEEILRRVGAADMPVVGVPLLSLNADPALELVNKIASAGRQVVLGGPMVSVDAVYVLQRCPDAAAAVIGQGEKVVPQLLRRLAEGAAIEDLPGVAVRQGDSVHINPPGPPLPGTEVPAPDFSLVDFSKYEGCFPIGLWPSASLMVTRGCPYDCGFCSNPVWHGQPRPVPPSTVVEWVEQLNRQGVREVFFVDDTFNYDPQWLDELCRALIDSGLSDRMGFKAPFRADLVSEEQLALLREAGFWMIFYGFESGSPEVLRYYRKGESPEDMRRALRLTRRAGIRSLASTIFGCPIDTEETASRTVEVLREADPDYAPIYPLIPYLGTRVAQDMVQRGWLTEEEIRHHDLRRARIRTETLTTEQVLFQIQWMRDAFAKHKRSPGRFGHRVRELVSLGSDRPDETARIEAEWYDSAVLPLGRGDRRIRLMPLAVESASEDVRLRTAGWHLREKRRGVEFRWCGGHVEIPFFLSGRQRRILLECAAFRDDKPLLTLTIIDAEGREHLLYHDSLKTGRWQTVSCPLPDKLSGETWVLMEVDPVFVPAARGISADTRELALAVRHLSIA